VSWHRPKRSRPSDGVNLRSDGRSTRMPHPQPMGSTGPGSLGLLRGPGWLCSRSWTGSNRRPSGWWVSPSGGSSGSDGLPEGGGSHGTPAVAPAAVEPGHPRTGWDWW
jgi:hypothetical protein